jgi:superfamily II DNA or RNA helicase
MWRPPGIARNCVLRDNAPVRPRRQDLQIPYQPGESGQNVAVRDPFTRGLYEQLLTESLERDLIEHLQNRDLVAARQTLHREEAADRIALHLASVVERAVAALDEDERVTEGVRLARRLVAAVEEAVPAAASGDAPLASGEILRALLRRLPDGSPERIDAPIIPLLDTTLLTNAPGEPGVGRQLSTEIASAEQIDVVMAFVRWTGIRPLLDAIRQHCRDGRALRVLTTTYTGSTEQAALDLLRDAGATVRISYDTSGTRLHAKAWLFHRSSGFSTAYIGSSNLTHSAQVTGLEWNVRISAARNRDVIDKFAAVFDSYWESGDFIDYNAEQFAEATSVARDGTPLLLSPLEVRLEPFQERLLEQLEVSRSHGRRRNLLVSATGTGKTVMAAVDYGRLRPRLQRDRLLFVAHREEILEQSRAVYRHVLRDAAFGERWFRGERPRRFEHVFASVQSLGAAGLEHLETDHFDVVVIDEFHHAAAPTYTALLEHLRPQQLLGLTATPERSDGLDVLGWFDGRIAAELRLWDAIDQHRLSPFHYYGIHDGIDLRGVPWRRGSGYETARLTAFYTADDIWARRVIAELRRHVDDPAKMRCLGFCVSIEHARFMARLFSEAGLAAVAVTATTAGDERRGAIADLSAGRLRVVFSVDVFNEGVDVPLVDTLLLLRPTDSPTLFLQQLGRGLRLAPGKDVCTVLDFVGQHRREYRMDRRYRALLGGTRSDLERHIGQGFPFLPAGCHLELDPVASRIVLNAIRQAVPDRWTAKVDELRAIVGAGHSTRLSAYLEETGLDLEDLYAGGRSWSALCEAARLPTLPGGPDERELRRGVGRLLHVDDALRLDTWSSLVAAPSPPDDSRMAEVARRLARMLVATVGRSVLRKDENLASALKRLWAHPQVLAELGELFEVLRGRVDHLHAVLTRPPDVPLRIHARYTRDEILAAFGVGAARARVAPWQTGVRHLEDARADLFAFTLDKTSGSFSPTTRYRDYAISRELIHWESQGVTRADSETGLRYQRHAERDSDVLLFARLRQDERAFWFLGPACYVSHSGERPMAITWRLSHALPGDLFSQFAAAVA